MLDFILDFIVGPLFDLYLCKFKWGNWLKHLFVSGVLLLAIIGFAAILWLGWEGKSWFWGILGLAGVVFFGYIDIRYEWWWYKEGRFED